VDPSDIDINIHPTKTEVNFLDVKLVYAIIHAAVRKAIGQHNLSPMIDFDESADLNNDFSAALGMSKPLAIPNVPLDPNFNPFRKESTPRERQWERPSEGNHTPGDWRILYGERTDLPEEPLVSKEETKPIVHYMQVNQSYIVTTVKSGLLVIDQHLAHSRVLFEKFLKEMENHNGVSQQELFPQALSLNINDASLLKEMQSELENLGFVLEQANPTTFMINGTPVDAAGCDAVALLEKILDNYKINRTDLQLDRKLNLAMTMSAQLSIKAQTKLSEMEMQNIVDQLFACNVAEVAPDGKKIYVILNMEDYFK
jgi:DNA mismatch repair protein MutL